MKIVFDHQVLGLQLYGGISRYFYEIANRIAATKGNEVEVFAPLYINEYFRKGGVVRPRGLGIPKLPRSGRATAWINAIISGARLRSRGDVDIFHETYYSGADCCPRAAKRIITVYDMIHEKLPAYFRKEDDTPELKALAVRRADHVICISENTRKDLVELLDVPEEKTSVVHLGYSLTVKASSEKLQVAEKSYILYVGHRNRFRNVERLLRAYAASDNLKNNFKLIFFGGGAFTAAEQGIFETLSLLPGSVMQISGGDDTLAALYSGASAFVYPSLYEGFGIPPLEAMSFGCPVVCSNTSSLPEVVGDAAELFNPEDEGDMLNAIERVVTSPARADVLVSRGRERCKQFSWEKCAMETLNVYEKILQK